MILLWLLVAGTTALLAMDAGCYVLLRANDARRALPIAGGRRPQAVQHG